MMLFHFLSVSAASVRAPEPRFYAGESKVFEAGLNSTNCYRLVFKMVTICCNFMMLVVY